MVEFVLVFPMFIILVFGILELAYMGFNYISFDFGCENALYTAGSHMYLANGKVDANRNVLGDEAEKAFKDAIIESSIGLKEKNISIEDPTWLYWTENNPPEYNVKGINNSGRTCHIYYDKKNLSYTKLKGIFTYSYKPLTPIGELLIKPLGMINGNKDFEFLKDKIIIKRNFDSLRSRGSKWTYFYNEW